MADSVEIPDELVIPLRKPVQLGDITYTELKLREPTAAEMLLWDKLSGTEADIKAVSTVAGIPEPAARMVGARDLIAGARYIGRFLS